MLVKYLLVAGISAGAGYFVAQKRLEQRYFAELNKETEEVRDFYERKYQRKKAQEAFKLYSGGAEKYQNAPGPMKYDESTTTSSLKKVLQDEAADNLAEMSDEDLARRAVKDKSEEEFNSELLADPAVKKYLEETASRDQLLTTNFQDYQEMSSKKSKEKPATPVPDLIMASEFINSDTGYKQFSVTYFAGDDILAGESDQVISLEARNVTMGETILEKLRNAPPGDDKFILYIRNHEQQVELEIARSEGKYSVEVGPIDESG
jgi:hypothetical protein